MRVLLLVALGCGLVALLALMNWWLPLAILSGLFLSLTVAVVVGRGIREGARYDG